MSDLPSPNEHSEVLLALRRAGRAKPRRPKQALGLTVELLEKMVAECPKTPAGLRDAALISVGYDTLCRSSELAAMRVDHVADDFASIRIARSKADQFGDGRIAYLSPETQKRLREWLRACSISEGAFFRSLHTRELAGGPLDTSSIRRLVKRAARRAMLDTQVTSGLSGHSMRIGAAQDMMVAGMDAIGIMQAGGWRSSSVLARYVENASAARMHVRRWRTVGCSQRRKRKVESSP